MRQQKANPCLKTFFYVLNSLLLIAGCLFLVVAIWATGTVANNNQSGGWMMWIFAVGLISISSLGIFGARRENTVALVIFAIAMMVGAIFLLIRGILFSVLLIVSQARQDIESQPYDYEVSIVLRAGLGIAFVFSATAILGVILSVCLLRQIGLFDFRKPSGAEQYSVPMHGMTPS